ncbi:MAG TPA: DNA starvation/stationary phase protection protein Dps [Planctomycetota bacterium]|nr:DNA starvation/stationary phase protection protein Dps [Planctomycetota bacterium]
MNPTRNDLPADARKKLVALLQDRLVDALDLYLQVKNSHWNVKGPTFIALHELFDKVAGDALGYGDDLAERAVQLGGTADGSAPSVAQGSSLPRSKRKLEEESDHVRAVADALAAFGKSVRKAIGTSDDLDDKDTADLFTEISRGTDKWLWFVESHLPGK